MKIQIIKNNEDRTLNKNYIELEDGEYRLDQYFFNKLSYEYGYIYGELYIPEGVEDIPDHCFGSALAIHTYYFPKTLEKISHSLWHYSYIKDYIKIVYKGSSDDFIKIAKTEVKEEYETDGFDRYPYYSGNSRWVTHYYSFDTDVKHIEVYCEEDNVFLDYGYGYRKNDEIPENRKQ